MWGFPVLCVFVVRAVFVLSCVLCVCGACVAGGRGGCRSVCFVCAGACVVCRWCVFFLFYVSQLSGWGPPKISGDLNCLPSPLRPWVGGSVWVWGLCVVVPRQSWLRGLAVGPRHSWLGSGGSGTFPCPLACSPRSSPWLRCLACCSPGACSGATRAVVGVRWGWVGGGGGLDAGSGPIPWCFPLGGPMLALPVSPSDPFCTPLSVAVEQRLNPVEQHVAVQPPS